MDEQYTEKPESGNESRDDHEHNGLKPEQAEAILKRLEEVLAADTPQELEAEEQVETERETSLEELSKGLEDGADIRVLPDDEVPDESVLYTPGYIKNVKKALDDMFSSESDKKESEF
jgi:hypothetical protein